MPSYTEFNEYPNSGMATAPSGAELMSCSSDPSYGSETNEWRPGYPLTSYETMERQPQYYPAPFPNPSWNVQRYPLPYNDNYSDNNIGFQLMVNQPPVPTRIAPSSTGVPSPEFPVMSALSSPRTPASVALSVGNSPNVQPSRAISRSPHVDQPKRGIYSHRDQLQFFREALSLPVAGAAGPFVPQLMYKPHTNSDRKRYVEEIELDAPIFFWMIGPEECGISLTDALHSRVKRLRDRDLPVFEGRGPSVSIRLEWPGYRQWSRQIPTKDFRSPPGPITLAKLAKNVAKCVQRFIEERQHSRLEDDADPQWQVGLSGKGVITLDDIVLVSMYHVSLGSWQPQLRLKRSFNQPARG